MRTISALDRKKQIRKRRFSACGKSGAINGDEKRFRDENDGAAKLLVSSADCATETAAILGNAESVESKKVVSAEGTPKKAFLRSADGRSPLSSPTGKRIMNALDGANVHIDNFHEERGNESQDNLLEEWLTAEVGRTSMKIGGGKIHDVPSNLGLVDWSLSCRLRLECFPSIAPLLLSSNSDDGCIHQLATQILAGCPSAQLLESCAEQDFLAARWLASTMFYQHPAVYPVPSFVPSQAGDRLENSAKEKQCLSTYVHGPLSIYNTTRLPKADVLFESKNDEKSSSMRAEKQKRHDAALLLDRRRKEWQLAFKSLFQTWMAKLRSLQRKPKSEALDDEMLRCVFYALSHDRVSLFRCARKPEGGPIEPTIEFSSVSEEFRSSLASMGILLRSKRNDLVDESLPSTETATLEKKQTSPSDKESVSAELNAIKWADNESGKVTVDLKRKAQDKGPTQRRGRSSAVYVSGEDDCFAVYEQLLNAYGVECEDSDHDVPLLICRSLGPCSHTTLSKLTATGQVEHGYTQQRVTNRDNASSIRDVLELQGFILPCAIRDMVCSLAHYFEGSNRPMDNSPTNVSDFYHGSRPKHPRFTLKIDEGLCNGQITLPTQTSCLNKPEGEEEEDFDSMIMCKDGFRVSFLTWDNSSPSEVTFNTKAKS